LSTRHVVKPGECLASIASRHGFASWRTVWDHGDNAALREKRKDPHVLAPGDEVAIPELPEAKLDLETGKAQGLVIERPPTLLRLRVLEAAEGQPVAARFELAVEGLPEPIVGDVGGDGTIEVEVPPFARKARLLLKDAGDGGVLDEVALRIGDLDPVSEPSGLRERLRRVGFDPGPEEGDPGPLTEAALRAFQLRHGLEVSGKATEETARKLTELVGV